MALTTYFCPFFNYKLNDSLLKDISLQEILTDSEETEKMVNSESRW